MKRNTLEIAACAAASLLAAWLAFAAPAARAQDATAVGEAKCLACHSVENEHVSETFHARVFRENPRNALERLRRRRP